MVIQTQGFASSKCLAARVRTMQWSPTKDVVAVLDDSGDLRVMRIWDVHKTWTSKQTRQADDVVWSPEGLFVCAIASSQGFVTTFNVETGAHRTASLCLSDDESLTAFHWGSMAVSNDAFIKWMDCKPRISTRSSSWLLNSSSLLVITTSRNRVFVLLNGLSLISESSEFDCGDTKLLDAWSQCIGDSSQIVSLVQRPNGVLTTRSFNLPLCSTSLGHISAMTSYIDQSIHALDKIVSGLEQLIGGIKAFEKSRRNVYEKFHLAFADHNVGVSSNELVRNVLTGESRYGIFTKLKAVSIHKSLKKHEASAKANLVALNKSFMCARSTIDEFLFFLGELIGFTSDAMIQNSCALTDTVYGLIGKTEEALLSLVTDSITNDKKCKDFLQFMAWLNRVTDTKQDDKLCLTKRIHIIMDEFIDDFNQVSEPKFQKEVNGIVFIM